MSQIKKFQPDFFELEPTSIWRFVHRGNWATHNGRYPGNWSPFVPRNLILRYSKKRDVVLDPFLGGGTTLIESKLLGRHGIGVDINPNAIALAKYNLHFDAFQYDTTLRLECADARDMYFIESSSVDLIATHPPYADMIRYSENLIGDLSLFDVQSFYNAMSSVALEMKRVLKEKHYCAILIGDLRRDGNIIPLGLRLLNLFIDTGFHLKEIVIKEQNNCRSTDRWKTIMQRNNQLMITHEYLFVFQK